MTDVNGPKKDWDLARFLPVLTWLPEYEKPWFRKDLFAAITIAAFSIPNLMAFSQLAGLPPQYGLYAGIGAGIGYFFFGTIKRMIAGPSASQAILVASVLIVLVGPYEDDPARYLAMASMAAILTGMIFLIARAIKLGFLVNLIPVPVFKGFLAGMGLTIIMSQLPKLFGVASTQGDFFTRLFDLLGQLGDTNLYTLGLGMGLMGLLFVMDWRFSRSPNTLIVVIIAIFVMIFSDLASKGVEVIGEIPRGLPSPTIPAVSIDDIGNLLPLAIGLFILSFVETTSIGRSLETRHSYKMDPDQEMVALGAANIFSGFLQGFPVSGSFARSFLNDHIGGKTQLVGLMSALMLLIVVAGFTGVFYNMPVVILAVLIIVAVYKLVDFKELHRIRMVSKNAFIVALASFAGVLVFGVLEGLLIGVVISFFYILYRISAPHMSILGRIPDTDDFKDVARNEVFIIYPAVLIVRFDAPLVFANSHTIKHKILDKVEEERFVELVILDMETSPMLDVTAADMLGELDTALHNKEILFRLANCTGEVRDMLKATYSLKRVGHIKASTTVNQIMEEWTEGNADHLDEEEMNWA
ncbi:MAG: sulfate permease [Thermoplasmata archaeon]|nr:sulfate permease [Thermoplasmata archaeon]